MIYFEEYQPHFVAFRKVRASLADQTVTEAQFEEQVEAFKRFLEALATRVTWELPLVGGFSRSSEVEETLSTAFAGCKNASAG